jgi:Cys-tRNA(Pro)/Cys-tRNA(Cys) deacylase
MGATPAVDVLVHLGTPFTLHEFRHDATSTGFGLEAAVGLDVEADRVCKTLVAVADGNPAIAVIPVSCELDLKALARVLGAKRAEMADPKVAERITGYVRGGISPLGQRQRLTTVLDSLVTSFETIYVSGGRRGLEIELAPSDLLEVTGGLVADVARAHR